MNLFAAFQSEVFRPLVTLLIPGALGISSWVLVLFCKYPHLKELAAQNRTETAVIIFLVTTAMGLLIEDLGSRFETYRDAVFDKRSNGEHTRIWNDYLRTAYEKDPIGRGYIRTVVLRLKFELGIAIASIFTVIGIVVLYFLGLSGGPVLVFALLLVGLSAYEWWEAKESHRLLATTREELLKNTQTVSAVRVAIKAPKQARKPLTP